MAQYIQHGFEETASGRPADLVAEAERCDIELIRRTWYYILFSLVSLYPRV